MDQAKVKRVFKEWILPFAIEILVVFLLIKFVFFFATVPTGSMIPTINKGDWLFTLRMYNPEENIQRGDILVFESDELGETLIKRVIGLPGEEVVVDDQGKVYINGELLDEPYVKNRSTTSGSFQVPEGCYLFFGDNRAGSYDARDWEDPYIPADKIIGKAVFKLWPLTQMGVLE